jgi:D-glycero-D-manno-heptose 1,7-bisphosphate phosphatase
MSDTAPRPAAFLDRDGTLIVEYGYLGDPALVEPLPGAVEAVRILHAAGYHVFGVSNQSGVARGYYDAETVDAVNQRIIDEFDEMGARIDRIYYCPHLPTGSGAMRESDCECRKPKDGMVRLAQREFRIDMSRSFVVGDQQADLGLAQSIGVPGYLVLTGFGQETRSALSPGLADNFIADNLLDAVRRHVGRSAHNRQPLP